MEKGLFIIDHILSFVLFEKDLKFLEQISHPDFLKKILHPNLCDRNVPPPDPCLAGHSIIRRFQEWLVTNAASAPPIPTILTVVPKMLCCALLHISCFSALLLQFGEDIPRFTHQHIRGGLAHKIRFFYFC